MPGLTVSAFFTYLSYAAAAYSLFMTVTADDDLPDTDQDSTGTLVNTRSVRETMPLVYGKGRVGGNQVFMTTTGTDNKYLHMIITLSEGEVNSIVQVDSVDQIFLDGELYTESDYKDNFTYEFFSGAPTQNVCSTLNTAYVDWVDPLRYTSYLYCRFTYDRDKFSSIPDITAVLEGLKVKNFETEDDYDSMPTVYSNNIAYCVYDLLTRSSVRGGKGIDPTRIDLPSFRDAATYYDTYGWTCNMTVNKDQSVEDNLDTLLVNGRSCIVYSNCKFKLKFRDTREESVCMQITKDDIIQDGNESSMEISPSASLFTRPNSIKTTFFSADKNYVEDEKVFTDDSALETEGDSRELSMSLLGLSSLDTVIPMSYYYLERSRWGNTVSITIGNKGMSLEPMDLVEITSVMPGWSEGSKPLYRVESVSLQEDGNVSLSLRQEHDDLYNDDYDIDTQELFYTDLPKPGDPVRGVINVSHSEEVYYYRDRSFTRWKILFDPPSVSDYPFWDYAEIWSKIDNLPGSSNLIGYWGFEESSGTTAADGSGYGNDCNLINMEDADWVEGIVGDCLSFDGVDEYATISGSVDLDTPNVFAISAWIYDEEETIDHSINKDDESGSRIWIIRRHTNTSVNFHVWNSNDTLKSLIPNNSWAMNQWFHIVCTAEVINGTIHMEVFFNGLSKGTTSFAGSSIKVDTTLPIRISTADNIVCKKQRVDELRIYKTIPTASEIKALYENPSADLTWKFMTKATSDYQLDPVEEGSDYSVKIRSVSTFGVKEDFDGCTTVSKRIVGKTGAPSDMTSITAVASGDTVSIYGDKISDPDIEGYEVRLGAAWNGGVFIAFNETPNFRISGVKPGTFTFWCSSKDNSGNYSTNPVSATCTIFYPPGYTDKNTWSWDYNGIGTHDNTEYILYSGNDCLKASHGDLSGDVLNEDCTDISDWVDGDSGSGASYVVDGEFYFYCGVPGASTYALRHRDIGTMPNQISFEINMRNMYTGLISDGDHFVIGLGKYTGAYNTFGFAATPNSAYIYNSGNWVEIGTNLINSDEFQTWRFLINYSTNTVDIYINDSTYSWEKVATAQAFTNYIDLPDGEIYLAQFAYTTGGRGSYTDYIKLQDGLFAPSMSLTGTWTSPEYDLGSLKTVRVWGDFETVFVSSAATWEGIYPVPIKWSEMGSATKWYELITSEKAAVLDAKIKWGTATGVYPNEADYFQILSPEFSARYLQVELEITDPQTDSNLYIKELNCKAAYWV